MWRRRRNVVIDSDDGSGEDDSFVSLEPPRPSTRGGPTRGGPAAKLGGTATSAHAKDASGVNSVASVRVRKLGRLDNDPTLLRSLRDAGTEAGGGSIGGRRSAWTKVADSTIDLPEDGGLSPSKRPQRRQATRPRVALRTRKARRASNYSVGSGDESAGELSTEEASVLEDVALEREDEEEDEEDEKEDKDGDEDGDEDGESSDSEFHASSSEDDDLFLDSLDDDDVFSWSPTKARAASPKKKATAATGPKGITNTARKTARPGTQPPTLAPPEDPSYDDDSSSVFFSAEEFQPSNLAKPLSQLSLNPPQSAPRPGTPPRPTTAAPTAAKTTGLISPTKKLPRIPQTPHRPSADAFWDQLLVDDWNTEHSPRKLLFGDTDIKGSKAAGTKTPGGLSPSKKRSGNTDGAAVAAAPTAKQIREAKKQFQQAKHARAEQFLAELDRTVTEGALARLAAATGGVRIVWTNKLNTTAGRANWRRETLRRKAAGASGVTAAVAAATGPADTERVLHHASIELADKVIDDEHRLLNVLAHEFCHLACFMVSGVTTQPHGRAFKQWAAQCSRHFGRSHGIEVTTKHTYEIDFKYVWTCAAPDCATQFKRHSKSIDPARHRCGVCRGLLVQTKPVPRGGGAAAGKGAGAGAGAGTTSSAGRATGSGGGGGPSAYQLFMKEHMAAVRQANPGSPQKEIMKLVAGKWSEAKALQKQKTADATETKPPGTASVDDLGKVFVDLTLG